MVPARQGGCRPVKRRSGGVASLDHRPSDRPPSSKGVPFYVRIHATASSMPSSTRAFSTSSKRASRGTTSPGRVTMCTNLITDATSTCLQRQGRPTSSLMSKIREGLSTYRQTITELFGERSWTSPNSKTVPVVWSCEKSNNHPCGRPSLRAATGSLESRSVPASQAAGEVGPGS